MKRTPRLAFEGAVAPGQAERSSLAANIKTPLSMIAEYRVAEAPVVADLVAAGFPVATIADLRYRRLRYVDAVPVLAAWLPRVKHAAVKEEIVQCLGVGFAKPEAARPLIDEFVRVDDPSSMGLRWAIGNALDVVADDSVGDELVDIALDTRYGQSREMLVVALGNLSGERVVSALVKLLDDEDVCGHALMALARLAPRTARPRVEPLLVHPTAWVRKEARKTLEAIERATARLH